MLGSPITHPVVDGADVIGSKVALDGNLCVSRAWKQYCEICNTYIAHKEKASQWAVGTFWTGLGV